MTRTECAHARGRSRSEDQIRLASSPRRQVDAWHPAASRSRVGVPSGLDAERAAEQPGLEHDVVARRPLAGLGGIRRRPVVLGEHERGEIDFLGELDEPVERRPARVERGRPGLDVGDILEPARNRFEQFGLLTRRAEETRGLVMRSAGCPSVAARV